MSEDPEFRRQISLVRLMVKFFDIRGMELMTDDMRKPCDLAPGKYITKIDQDRMIAFQRRPMHTIIRTSTNIYTTIDLTSKDRHYSWLRKIFDGLVRWPSNLYYGRREQWPIIHITPPELQWLQQEKNSKSWWVHVTRYVCDFLDKIHRGINMLRIPPISFCRRPTGHEEHFDGMMGPITIRIILSTLEFMTADEQIELCQLVRIENCVLCRWRMKGFVQTMKRAKHGEDVIQEPYPPTMTLQEQLAEYASSSKAGADQMSPPPPKAAPATKPTASEVASPAEAKTPPEILRNLTFSQSIMLAEAKAPPQSAKIKAKVKKLPNFGCPSGGCKRRCDRGNHWLREPFPDSPGGWQAKQ